MAKGQKFWPKVINVINKNRIYNRRKKQWIIILYMHI